MNGEKKSFNTDDVEKTISENKPDVLKTQVVFVLDDGKKTVERLLYVMRAKRVFNNPFATKIFARDLVRAIQ